MSDDKALTPEQIAKAERKAAKKAKKLAEKETQQQSTTTTPAETTSTVGAEETEEERKKREKKEKKAAKKDKKRSRDEGETEAVASATKEEEATEPKQKKSKKDKKNAPTETKEQPVASTSTSTSNSTATSNGSVATAQECADFLKENNITHTPEEAATEYPPVLSFASLPLNDGVRKGLSGYTKPTPIQSAAFPVMLGGRDVIGIAETGSGKTVAFGVPAIEHILTLPQSKKGKSTAPVSVLIICPTRELAMQTHNNLDMICSALSPPLASVCLYGGVSKPDQIRTLRNERPRIVVGTPGRLLDLARENSLDLSKVSWLVLDEADRMLDKGFENDIREIIKLCMPSPSGPLRPITEQAGEEPRFRRTAMFSATWPMSVRQLAADFMTSPLRITVGSDSLQANSRVEQTAIVVADGRQKENLLLTHLRDNGFSQNKARSDAGGKDREKALIFALYKKEATRLFEMLKHKGFQVGCINGDMSQEKRTQSLADFKEGRVGLLVATDVAARGLDIPKVELVINVTFPLTIEDYIHRIGRTGRAGRTGKSITFFTEADKALAGQYIRLLRDSNAVVPPGLDQWGTTIKKQVHSSYGAHFKEPVSGVAKKITFD
ncbi:DEAD/DEAH box helicase [Sporobolomyces salmoneus]|uniref:DEAD/DEAH box helicase n=1 Tax=Sporobolomyces salmoneus TaxID=183962 RepID=UPI00317C56FD